MNRLFKSSVWAKGVPQIKFALSRGFSVSGFDFWDELPRAALEDSLALGYYRPPLQGFQLAASPTDLP